MHPVIFALAAAGAAALRGHPTLRTLDLSHCPALDDRRLALLAPLPALTDLLLSHCMDLSGRALQLLPLLAPNLLRWVPHAAQYCIAPAVRCPGWMTCGGRSRSRASVC